jgi:hypothetical protein
MRCVYEFDRSICKTGEVISLHTIADFLKLQRALRLGYTNLYIKTSMKMVDNVCGLFNDTVQLK